MKQLRRVIFEAYGRKQPGKQAKRAMRNQEPKGNPPKEIKIDAQPGEAPGSARKRAGLKRFRRTPGSTPGQRRRIHDRAVKQRKVRLERAATEARRAALAKERAAREALAARKNAAENQPEPEKNPPKPENSNTAYPLTANRVHIHEINIIRVKADKSGKPRLATGNGTQMKGVRERGSVKNQTVSRQRADASVLGPNRPNRPRGKKVLRTAELGLDKSPGETNS